MLEEFSLGSYLMLVDYTGRLFRDGKVTMASFPEAFGTDPAEVVPISRRIQTPICLRFALRNSAKAQNPVSRPHLGASCVPPTGTARFWLRVRTVRSIILLHLNTASSSVLLTPAAS